MSAINQRHLLEVLSAEIEKVGDIDRVDGYSRHLRVHLTTVLAFERDHRTRGTNIKAQVLGQVEALASTLSDSDWQPGGPE